ncbi:MAG: type I 3-dehydroquinate dehydratase [Candidatus Angelobacter sp.]
MASTVVQDAAAIPSRVCVSIGEATPEMLLQAAHAESHLGESFFEVCLEFLENPYDGPETIREFLRAWPQAWIIVTCRSGEQNFRGSIEQQLGLLAAAVEAGARGIDIEVETARNSRAWLDHMGGRCMRIVSYHNYTDCPPLDPIVEELESFPAEFIKIAVGASDTESLCRLTQVAQRCRKPNLMLAMGKQGLPTRIMAPILGRSFTYASPSGHDATAPGQLDARTLRKNYRLDDLDFNTKFIFTSCESDRRGETPTANIQDEAWAAGHTKAICVPWPDMAALPKLH